MASFKQYTASGGASEAFSIPSFTSDEIKVYVDNVLKTATTHYNITSYTTSGGTVTWTSGNVPNGVVVRIVRDTKILNNAGTDVEGKDTYAAGSSVKADSLNDNQKQALRALEEQDDQLIQTYDIENSAITTAKIKADNITNALIADDQIDSEHYVAGSIDLEHMSANSVDSDQYVDGSIDLVHMSANSVDSDQYVDGSIDLVHMSANSVDSDQYVDGSIDLVHMSANSVDSDQYVDGSIDLVHMSANSVDSDQYVDGSIDLAHMSANSIDSDQYVDGSIDHVHLSNDCIDGDNIQDDVINSEHYATGSIDTEHLAGDAVTEPKIADNAVTNVQIADDAVRTAHILDSQVTTAKIEGNAITEAKIDDNAVTSAQIADDAVLTASISNLQVTTAKIAGDAVTEAKIADNAVTTVQIAADAVTTAKIANNAITSAKIAANAVTTSEIADAELTTLAGMQTGTASILAGGTALTATLAEINTVVDGKSVETTISDTDAAYPTSGAVVDYVAAQIAPIGGLEVIANDASFPNTQPAAGVVISIADAGGLVINGSGTSTTGRTLGGSTVTINNIASNFNSTTVDNGVAFMVSSTGSGQIYNYHKATLKEADLLSISGEINDFAERYRVAGSAPSSSLDEGDLWWDTATDKLKVYDGSAWEEVASSGDFFINTISSYSGTGGNSSTFNGSAYRFVLSNPGSSAQQHVVSINGVIQKPNSGTSQPSEGFVINGSSIIFSNAPASGSDYFILTLGTTVSIGTPSDNTVATAKIQNLAVTTDKVASDAITEAKIANNAVTSAQIAADAVTTAKIPDANITTAKIAGDAVTEAKIANNAVTTLQIADDAVTTVKIPDSNITTAKIAGDAVTEAKLADNAVTTVQIANDAVTTVKIADNAVTSAKIPGDAITEAKIADDAVTTVQMANNAVTTAKILDANITTAKIASDAVTEPKIANDAVTSAQIADDAVLTAHILDANITTAKIAGDAITEPKIANDAITGAQIADDAVGAEHIEVLDANLQLADNAKIQVGTGNDWQMYHDGNDSIMTNSTGVLTSWSEGNHEFKSNSNGHTRALFKNGSGCELYDNNSKKLSTTSTGIKVTGIVHVDDSDKLVCGTSQDLNIYHDGSYNYIASTNTTQMRIVADAWRVRTYTGSETLLQADVNGAVSLNYDNVKKFETTSDGTNLSGTVHKVEGLLRPYNDNTWDVGSSSDRWDDIYATNGTIQTSDKNEKNTIVDSDLGLSFVNKLKPVSYKFNGKTRTHYGLIAQDVETVITDLGKTTTQFAPLIKDTLEDGTERYGLRYGEFISPLIKAVQELSAEVETLKTKVAALEAK